MNTDADLSHEPEDAERLRQEADGAIERYKDYLNSPTFQHSLDVAVLTKIAGDDKADIRERRRAAEVLAKLRLQAMEGLSELLAVREQTLDRLGIKSGSAPSLSMTQVNNRIEIVRASDWRNAAPLEPGEDAVVQVLPKGASAAPVDSESGRAADEDLGASAEQTDGADPPA